MRPYTYTLKQVLKVSLRMKKLFTLTIMRKLFSNYKTLIFQYAIAEVCSILRMRYFRRKKINKTSPSATFWTITLCVNKLLRNLISKWNVLMKSKHMVKIRLDADHMHPAFSCLKSTIKTPEQCLNSVWN